MRRNNLLLSERRAATVPTGSLIGGHDGEGYVGTPLFDSNGRALGLMAVLYGRPIANPKRAESILKIFAVRAGAELERRRAQARLRKSEERWRRVFENSAIGIALTDRDGRFLTANAAYQAMLGYTEKELRARSWLDVTHEDDRKGNWALFMDFLEKKPQQLQVQKRYRRKDAQILWVSNNISWVPGAEGTPDFIITQAHPLLLPTDLSSRVARGSGGNTSRSYPAVEKANTQEVRYGY